MTQSEPSLSLMETAANTKTVELLFSKGLINHQGHDLALEFLYPHQRWGYWISSLILIIGIALILAGLALFFVLNWPAMSLLHKLSIIGAGLLCCVFGSWTYSSHKMVSKLFLVGACILVGVFAAVYGKIL